jgi:hypothetical protein
MANGIVCVCVSLCVCVCVCVFVFGVGIGLGLGLQLSSLQPCEFACVQCGSKQLLMPNSNLKDVIIL